jgi:hypothetical protein
VKGAGIAPMTAELKKQIRADHERDLQEIERCGLGPLLRGNRTRTTNVGDLLKELERVEGVLEVIASLGEAVSDQPGDISLVGYAIKHLAQGAPDPLGHLPAEWREDL